MNHRRFLAVLAASALVRCTGAVSMGGDGEVSDAPDAAPDAAWDAVALLDAPAGDTSSDAAVRVDGATRLLVERWGRAWRGDHQQGVPCLPPEFRPPRCAERCCNDIVPGCLTRAQECRPINNQGRLAPSYDCDGQEDCAGGAVCCAVPFGATAISRTCVEAGACPAPARVCSGDDECASGEHCCEPVSGGGTRTYGLCHSGVCPTGVPLGPPLARAPTPGGVSCGGRVCGACYLVYNDDYTAQRSVCEQPEPVRSSPLRTVRCDGPEDCAAGSVCCVSEGSVQCQPAEQCLWSAMASACHSDATCAPGEHCCRAPRSSDSTGFVTVGVCDPAPCAP